MGILKHEPTGATITLAPRTVCGRAAACTLALDHPATSKEHAVLWWEHDAWWVRDLGSRNGTMVDGERMPTGEVTQLHEGSTLAFAVEGEAWSLVDAAPPERAAEILPGTEDVGDDGPSHLALHFGVSPDEEFVEITLCLDEEEQVLDARVYHYMLLTLARAWQSDAAMGVDGAARGWVYASELAKMLRIDERTLNVHVFRARRQLHGAGVPEDHSVLERQGRLGQIRLSVDAVVVRTLQSQGASA